MAAILSTQALVEDWEVVNGSLDSIEKALYVVSSHLPDRVAQTATGIMGQIFLKVNVASAL